MRIRSIEIDGFRSIRQLSMGLAEGLTILVGENGTGKSSISAALGKLFAQCSTNGDQIVPEDDYPFGVVGELRIEASLQLSTAEMDILHRYLVPAEPVETRYLVVEWLKRRTRDIKLFLRRPSDFNDAVLQLGDVELTRNQIFNGTATGINGGPLWFDGAVVANLEQKVEGPIQLGAAVPRLLAENRYKVFTEFREPVSRDSRTSVVESFAGSETASVLLNLKNHADESERRRYGLVRDAFSLFFPRLEMEAVERQPGAGIPDIQLKYQSDPFPLRLNHVSSGVH